MSDRLAQRVLADLLEDTKRWELLETRLEVTLQHEGLTHSNAWRITPAITELVAKWLREER